MINEDLKQLAGSWICRSETAETEEIWLVPKGGLMPGLNRTVYSDGRTAYEFLRIYSQENVIFYAASPNGRPPTMFKLIESKRGKLVFENPENDFPKRIIYEFITGGKMTARIEAETENGLRSMEWLFEKVDN